MERNNRKKRIFTIFIILAIICIAGYFMYSYYTSLTTSWLTYESEQSGYSVKYPKGFTRKSIGLTDTDWQYNPEIADIYKEGVVISKLTRDVKFFISVYKNSSNLNLRDWINHYIANDSEEIIKELDNDFEDKEINGMPALQDELRTKNQIIIEVFTAKNDLIFNISYLATASQDNNLDDKIFQRFLSTLRFE